MSELQTSFNDLLSRHDEMIVRSVVVFLEHNTKWLHSSLYEMRLPDDVRVRLLALRDRLHPAALVASPPEDGPR